MEKPREKSATVSQPLNITIFQMFHIKLLIVITMETVVGINVEKS